MNDMFNSNQYYFITHATEDILYTQVTNIHVCVVKKTFQIEIGRNF